MADNLNDMSPKLSPEEEQFSKSQVPEFLEIFGDIVENYYMGIILFFSTLICITVSSMVFLRSRIARQENAHKNCKSKFETKFDKNFGKGNFGTVISQPPRHTVFSEHIPDSVLDTMPRQKAELIRAEKEIAQSLSEQQKLREAEAQRKQLEEVYKLMEMNQEKFGEPSMDKLYSQVTMYGK